MANVVPKREPCVKCNNPVFFAERLVIENHLYHRTCFRCARCHSVLTLGNFYQTEKDNEFCCETCPDEELKTKRKVDESNRLSIAQRIALFEKTETSSVLKKSLSDEEKTKSLNRQLPSSTAATSVNSNSNALNNFLTSQIVDDDEKTNESQSSESESDDELVNDDKKLFETKSDHSNSINNDSNIISTKELTQTTQAHQNESQEQLKQIVNDIILVSSNENVDDIELEFEKLAEEAVNNPIPLLVSPNIITTKLSTQAQEIVDKEKEEPTIIIEESIESKSQPQVSVQEKNEEEKVEVIKIEEQTKVEENKTELIEEEKLSEEILKEKPVTIAADISISSQKTLYPDDLNPFGDDDEQKEEEKIKRPSLNPFGSCSEDEEEDIKFRNSNTGTLHKIQKPPRPSRPPLPRVSMTLKPASTNPFGSDDEDEESASQINNKTPVPTTRKQLHSMTPEPAPRFNNSPGHSLNFKGSSSSLASSTDGITSLRRKKKKAPAPPVPVPKIELESSTVKNDNDDKSTQSTPKKKRQAPTPPSSTSFKAPEKASTEVIENTENTLNDAALYVTPSETINGENHENNVNESTDIDISLNASSLQSDGDQRRLIPLEESLIEEGASSSSINSRNETQEVTYRRKIVPLSPTSPDDDSCENLEQIKDHKEAENRQRQSQSSLKADSTDSLPYLNKSSHGKWKRRKGKAPTLPFALPQRRVLQMLPLQEIRHELEIIEVQQQGLEKQGVQLEKMIRERCEGDNRTTEELLEQLPNAKNPKEVEELILQLFELVNEKNELFRRQAELMYLRRAHRLEEEQADVEYEIRKLMAQPEHNKTDSDKAREEALIARLVEIVQLRNEVVDCLEMDRLREAEEDLSIKQRMESHTAKLDQEYLNQTPTKLSKKEKKKLKEAKKMKNKKLNDADKDLDTSEMKAETGEKKKKKKKFLF
ncbi:hypothetical protein PVAND_011956 [Polypedilum vanderplanki]|uniref:MICAL-like protein 1 n=1 Tax=Polypedilum vanderplanki TaxID=319348 RepID=A0A9J6CKY7_POLVA|nr:hypothetical protein PVAND_011956 [Polypedilum vanderplanki]